jgi:hypothetical protein
MYLTYYVHLVGIKEATARMHGAEIFKIEMFRLSEHLFQYSLQTFYIHQTTCFGPFI